MLSEGPSSVTVPDVRGQDEASAEDTLEDRGFQVQVEDQETTDPTQEGRVISQNPAPGVQVAPGSTVTITVGRLSGTTTSKARSAGPHPPGLAIGLRRRAGL